MSSDREALADNILKLEVSKRAGMKATGRQRAAGDLVHRQQRCGAALDEPGRQRG